MKVEVKNKLEDTLMEVNRQGYIVTRSYIDGDKLILIAQKTKRISTSHLNIDWIEKEKQEIYIPQKKTLRSIWNGFKMRIIN